MCVCVSTIGELNNCFHYTNRLDGITFPISIIDMVTGHCPPFKLIRTIPHRQTHGRAFSNYSLNHPFSFCDDAVFVTQCKNLQIQALAAFFSKLKSGANLYTDLLHVVNLKKIQVMTSGGVLQLVPT